ncbi:MAG: hypothetical protein KAW16_00800 [candidate division Zixibacteria bacterium]|nr:hypothetical protein [candidate division Zixibacteria bacterium]
MDEPHGALAPDSIFPTTSVVKATGRLLLRKDYMERHEEMIGEEQKIFQNKGHQRHQGHQRQ